MNLRAAPFFLLLLCFAGLCPWIAAGWAMSGNADNLWLAQGLMRILAGQHMARDFYEQNPPAALFLYLPSVGLHALTSIALDQAIFSATAVMTGFAACAVWGILRPWTFLGDYDRVTILGAFLYGSTLLATTFFGERDHYAALALVPYALIQFAITFHLPRPKWSWLILVAAAPIILVKPHYGLLPVAMILHRAMRERRFTVIRDADFIALAAATIFITAIMFAFFSDYIHVILPDALKFYEPVRDYAAVFSMTWRYAGISFIALLAGRLLSDQQRRFFNFLIMAALINLVPYIVQGRGYYYHLLPATLFLWIALGYWMFCYLSVQRLSGIAAAALTAGLLLFAGYKAEPLNQLRPSRAEYMELPLVKIAGDCGHPPCSSFVFGQNFEIVQKILYYSNAGQASRFGAYWFLPPIAPEKAGSPFRKKYAGMTAEDFSRFKPEIVMVEKLDQGQASFDFVGFFSQDDRFKKEWRHYRKEKTITDLHDNYLPNTLYDEGKILKFDVYRRVADRGN